MDISEEEVWLRAYCAMLPTKHSLPVIIDTANDAVKDFAKRFPKFRFYSEENKDPK